MDKKKLQLQLPRFVSKAEFVDMIHKSREPKPSTSKASIPAITSRNSNHTMT
jgi:hypothetical protein